MGCTHWTKQRESEGAIGKPNQNGFKSLFHATTEFDLSRSESEGEEGNLSLNSIKNNKQSLSNRIVLPSNELNSTNKTSSTTVNSILDNQIAQTGV